MTTNNSIERRTNHDLFNPKLGGTNISDLLKRKLVGNLLVSPSFVWINDVLINLIIGVSFLRKVCPKSCIILQVLSLFAPWLLQRIGVQLIVFFHFFSFWIPLYILLHKNEAMNALDQLTKRISKREVELKRQRKEKEGEERGL